MIVTPSANEVSFGRIAGRVGRGTSMVIVSVDGRVAAKRDLAGGRSTFDFHVALPLRDVRLTVTAVGDARRRASRTVAPVFGLPRTASPRAPPRAHGDARLARTIRGLARGFPGLCGVSIRDLRTGAVAAWNARAEFPAASTLKVAIAIEVLRVLRGKPQPGSTLDRLLRKMLVPSDDKAANALLVWLGGSTSGGSARVNAMVRSLGLYDTDMYGGYEVQSVGPSFVGKRTTASDFERLLHYLHLAAEGKGRLARRFRGSLVPADARFLLFLLAHARPNWLDRHLPRGQAAVLHKPGWITRARHDGGLVYSENAAFVVVVMTWNEGGVGVQSELLAGRVARAALARLSALARKTSGRLGDGGADRKGGQARYASTGEVGRDNRNGLPGVTRRDRRPERDPGRVRAGRRSHRDAAPERHLRSRARR